jgi:hypothetical protein
MYFEDIFVLAFMVILLAVCLNLYTFLVIFSEM